MRKGSGQGTQAGWREETKQVPRNGVKGHGTKQGSCRGRAVGREEAGWRLVRLKCWGNLDQGAGEIERLFAGLKRNKLRICLFVGIGVGRQGKQEREARSKTVISVASEGLRDAAGLRECRMISRDSEPFTTELLTHCISSAARGVNV